MLICAYDWSDMCETVVKWWCVLDICCKSRLYGELRKNWRSQKAPFPKCMYQYLFLRFTVLPQLLGVKSLKHKGQRLAFVSFHSPRIFIIRGMNALSLLTTCAIYVLQVSFSQIWADAGAFEHTKIVCTEVVHLSIKYSIHRTIAFL